MKKIFAVIALLITFSITLEGQTPRFHSATNGVKIRYHNELVWKEPPIRLSPLSVNDKFSLVANDTISIISGKYIYLWSSSEKIIIKVKDIIEQKRKSVWTAVWKSIDDNTKGRPDVAKYGKSSAGSIRMSSEIAEKDYACQIGAFFRVMVDERRQLIDTSIVLQKQYLSQDAFYFRLYNNSARDEYIYIIQKDREGIHVTFNQTWTSEDGEVSLVFCLPASSSLDIEDFIFFEDGETQYIPIALKDKLNTKLLQEELRIVTSIPEKVSRPLKIGVCLQ